MQPSKFFEVRNFEVLILMVKTEHSITIHLINNKKLFHTIGNGKFDIAIGLPTLEREVEQARLIYV